MRRHAADNITALHSQFTAGFDAHTAAGSYDIWGSVRVRLLILISSAAGDDAAGDGLAAVFSQHPQAVAVRGKFVRRVWIAVRNRQLCARIDADALGDRQHITVQVDGEGTVNLHRVVIGDIVLQLDGASYHKCVIKVLCCCRRACADAQRQHHAEGEQKCP